MMDYRLVPRLLLMFGRRKGYGVSMGMRMQGILSCRQGQVPVIVQGSADKWVGRSTIAQKNRAVYVGTVYFRYIILLPAALVKLRRLYNTYKRECPV